LYALRTQKNTQAFVYTCKLHIQNTHNTPKNRWIKVCGGGGISGVGEKKIQELLAKNVKWKSWQTELVGKIITFDKMATDELFKLQ